MYTENIYLQCYQVAARVSFCRRDSRDATFFFFLPNLFLPSTFHFHSSFSLRLLGLAEAGRSPANCSRNVRFHCIRSKTPHCICRDRRAKNLKAFRIAKSTKSDSTFLISLSRFFSFLRLELRVEVLSAIGI